MNISLQQAVYEILPRCSWLVLGIRISWTCASCCGFRSVRILRAVFCIGLTTSCARNPQQVEVSGVSAFDIGDVLLLQTDRESETADEHFSERSARLPSTNTPVSILFTFHAPFKFYHHHFIIIILTKLFLNLYIIITLSVAIQPTVKAAKKYY